MTEWKTKNDDTIKEFLELKENINTFQEFLDDRADYEGDSTYKDEIKEFTEKFPLERIRELSLEEYDTKGSKETFTYYLEYKTKAISGGFFGANRNKLFFQEENGYNTAKFIRNRYPQKSVRELFDIFKNDMYTFVKSFDRNSYSADSNTTLLRGANYISSKLINLYYPNATIHIDSLTILSKIAKHFKIKHSKSADSIEINIAIEDFIKSTFDNVENYEKKALSEILWRYYEHYISIDLNDTATDDDQVVETEDVLFIDDRLIKDIVDLMRRKKNIIVQGAPGVGKTYSIKRIIKKHFDIQNADEQIKTIQFHQSYSYEEFIEGLRPTTHDAGFVETPGIFKEFVNNHVILNPNKDYFLIIDEINRGNLSNILGELMLLIEHDKREKEKVILPYSNELFYVPKNLYIIGTMNTADRSLALIDYALRRRFSFVTLKPMFNTEKFNGFLKEKTKLLDHQVQKINNTMLVINENITKALGPNFQIGHGHFAVETFEDFDQWYKNIVKYDIIPLLEEYFFDSEDTIKKILTDLDIDYES